MDGSVLPTCEAEAEKPSRSSERHVTESLRATLEVGGDALRRQARRRTATPTDKQNRQTNRRTGSRRQRYDACVTRGSILLLVLWSCAARTGLPIPSEREADASPPSDAGLDTDVPGLCVVRDLGELPIEGELVALHAVGNPSTVTGLLVVETERGSFVAALDSLAASTTLRPDSERTLALGTCRDVNVGHFVRLVEGPEGRRLQRLVSSDVLTVHDAPPDALQVAHASDDSFVATHEGWLRGRFGGRWEGLPFPARLRGHVMAVMAREGRATLTAVDELGAWWIDEEVTTQVLEGPDLVLLGNTGRAAVVLDASPAMWIADRFEPQRFDLAAAPSASAVAGAEEHDAVVLHVGDEVRVFAHGTYVDRFEARLGSLVGEARVAIAGVGIEGGPWPQFVIVWGLAGSREPLRLATLRCPGLSGHSPGLGGI